MCNNERKPHVHAEVIKAWADGHEVQYYRASNSTWVDTSTPDWVTGWRYRIKPEQTDLEKYGVEKGDVWLDKDGLHCFIEKVRDKEEVQALYLYNRRNKYIYPPKEVCVELRFRRGVVDKLGC